MSGGMPAARRATAFSDAAGGADRDGARAARDHGSAGPSPATPMPKTTAASPIIAPTDRSMPPVTMTGVSAMASRPSSTLSRVISKKLPAVAKFGAIASEERDLGGKTTSRMMSPVRKPCRAVVMMRSRRRRPRYERAAESRIASIATAARMIAPWMRALPVRADAEERQRRADGAEQHDAEQRAGDRAAAAGDRRAADDDGGDDLELEAEAGVARNLIEAHGIEHARQGPSAPPATMNTANVTSAVSKPASRAASRFEPVA